MKNLKIVICLVSLLSSVASMAKPAGWWTGNVVKYDTVIELPSVSGLKPGMSVEVEVILARYENVLKVPAAAVLETSEGHVCWVKQGDVVQLVVNRRHQ